ncbi:hypothetical protein ACFRJ1_05045 [Streptomyces sp. NPDC056773]|uniref:hypothetical protein n=1 Tax=unclassified Streptomyces TaxID=2593676 RepID=UPI00367A34D5
MIHQHSYCDLPHPTHRSPEFRPPAVDPSYLGFLLSELLAPGDHIAIDTVRALEELTASNPVAAGRRKEGAELLLKEGKAYLGRRSRDMTGQWGDFAWTDLTAAPVTGCPADVCTVALAVHGNDVKVKAVTKTGTLHHTDCRDQRARRHL